MLTRQFFGNHLGTELLGKDGFGEIYRSIHSLDSNMNVSHLLFFCFSLIKTTAVTGDVPIGFEGDVLDAIAGETFLVKTWTDNRPIKSITVSKGNAIRLTALFSQSNLTISKDQYGVILLQYNNATREMSLILENCGKEDEGIYYVDEIVADTSPNNFEREAGKWNFKLNVIESSEVKECDVGGIFKKEIRKSSMLRNLYYYDQIVANLLLCRVAIHSHLHGRLRCSRHAKKHVLNIRNVIQRDIGLYTVVKTNNGSNNGCTRYYLNVTDQITHVTIGESVTIDWFYSQQAINRTLRIIHSNNGIIMNLQPNNHAQIVPAFQTRLLYSGDVSRCYMSFTLLNIEHSDSGIYELETLHGTTVSGCKHITVEGITTHSSSARGPSLVHSSEISDTDEYTTSLSLTVRLTSPSNAIITDAIGVPIYVVIPVAIVTLVMVGYVIWIHHKRLSTLETDRPHLLEECDHELYITPIGGEIHLPLPLMNDGHASDSITAQSDSRMLILHTNQNMCMDGYEMVDVSSIDAVERICNSNETLYEPTETISKPVDDNFGYLSVLGVLETSV